MLLIRGSRTRLLQRPLFRYCHPSAKSASPHKSGQAGAVAHLPSASIGLGGGGGGAGRSYQGGFAVGDGRASAAGDLGALNPRQLSAHLDEFVVGQERAKKVLAVAVYNHYARLKQMSPLTSPEEDLSYSFATGSAPSPTPTLNFGPPHVARVQPRDRSRDADPTSAPIVPTLPAVPTPVSSTLFDPSYVAPSTKAIRRTRTSSTSASTHEGLDSTSQLLDPTNYASPIHSDPAPSASAPSPTLAETSPRLQRGTKRARVTASSSHPDFPSPAAPINTSHQHQDSDLLTDFIGQVPGSLPPPPRPGPFFDASAPSYEKSNVLLLGPTGSGKSLLARTLARCLNVPFVGIEATGLTMAGYVGEDVETCVHRLLAAAEWDPARAERGIIFIDEVDKISRSSSASFSKDVSGEGVQQALLKILEGTIVSVPDPGQSPSSSSSTSSGRRPPKGPPPAHHLVDTTNILFVLSGAFVGLEKIIKARLGAKMTSGMGFLSSRSASEQEKGKRQEGEEGGDKQQWLEKVEPADLVKFGFIPEFIGRLPIHASLRPLTVADLLRVLTEPRNALVKQYEDLFRVSDVQLSFTSKALKVVAEEAVKKGTGARGLRGILEKVLLEPMFTAPQSSIRYVLITRAVVMGKKEALYYSRGQKHIFENDYLAEEEEQGSGEDGASGGQGGEAGVEDPSAVEVEAETEPERRRATG